MGQGRVVKGAVVDRVGRHPRQKGEQRGVCHPQQLCPKYWLLGA
jgi:hypothetical protein